MITNEINAAEKNQKPGNTFNINQRFIFAAGFLNFPAQSAALSVAGPVLASQRKHKLENAKNESPFEKLVPASKLIHRV